MEGATLGRCGLDLVFGEASRQIGSDLDGRALERAIASLIEVMVLGVLVHLGGGIVGGHDRDNRFVFPSLSLSRDDDSVGV